MGVSIKDIRWVQISVTLASRSGFGGQILWKSWECSAKGLKLILWCTATHLCVMLPSKTHSVLRCTVLYLQFSFTGLLSPDFLLKVPPHAQPSALSSCPSSRSWHCSLNPLHHPSPAAEAQSTAHHIALQIRLERESAPTMWALACGSPWTYKAGKPDMTGWSRHWHLSCGGATAAGHDLNRG